MSTTSSTALLLAFVLCCSLSHNHAAAAHTGRHHHRRPPPPVTLVGTVYCDTCFDVQKPSKTGHLIADALVAVECGAEGGALSFRKEVETDKRGVFRVRLPGGARRGDAGGITACSVELVRSSHPFCAVAAASSPTKVFRRWVSWEGSRTYSAGFFTFRPLRQPDLCYQTPSPASAGSLQSSVAISRARPLQPSRPRLSRPPLLPPTRFPQSSSLLPPLTLQVPPLLPSNQLLPPISLQPTNPFQQTPNLFQPPSLLPPINPFQPPSLLPNNPFQPPPSLLPTNPLQPPPSLLPPNPLQPPPARPFIPANPFQQPPPSPAFNFPTLPGLTPSPPPPAFRLPPFSFLPLPLFPGNPPSSRSNTTSP